MPELAELFLATEFINKICLNRLFAGPVVKAEIHKSKTVARCNGYVGHVLSLSVDYGFLEAYGAQGSQL
jgi:hypothetical protein